MKRAEFTFLQRHKRIKKRRTPGKSVALKIIMGFCLFILALNLVSIGIYFKQFVADQWPGKEPVALLNRLLLYWFCIEFVIRYGIQSLPVMDIVPYLHLPVQKNSLIRFLQLKGFSHPANYLTFLFFIPVAFSTLSFTYTTAEILVWLLMLLGCTWLVTIGALHVKRRELIKPSSSYLFLAIFVAIGAADYWEWPVWFSLSALSGHLVDGLIRYPFLCVVPFALTVGLTQWNYRFMRQHAYIDETIQTKQERVEMHGSMLGRYFGLTGSLIDLDIKLAWRNKRTRSQVYVMVVFLLYGLFLYPGFISRHSLFQLTFLGIFLSGYPMSVYGQMPFDSAWFEGQMSRLSIYNYIKSRYILFVSLTIISYIITLPYAFFGMEVLKINFACLLFNLSITPILLLHMAALSRKGVDISQSSVMNMQGITFTQFFIVMLIVFIPSMIAVISGTIWAVAGLGIAGILTSPWQLKWVEAHFIRQKHHIIEGFRKKHS